MFLALAVVMLSWLKIGERIKGRSQKIDDLHLISATCQSGTLAMLSSKVNSPFTHESTWMMTDMAPRGL